MLNYYLEYKNPKYNFRLVILFKEDQKKTPKIGVNNLLNF
jgi:hypothetical protein